MNVTPLDRQIAIISALTEGCSIRTTERLTGVHRDTIMRLAARVGFGAMRFHDHKVHSLRVNRVELRGVDVADDRLTALSDMDVLDRHLLLAFRSVALERLDLTYSMASTRLVLDVDVWRWRRAYVEARRAEPVGAH